MTTATLPRYNLSPPTEADARDSLSRICNDDGNCKWEQMRSLAKAGDDQPLTLEQLQSLAEHCVARQGCHRVFGVSLLVRIQTYLTLREQLRGLEPC